MGLEIARLALFLSSDDASLVNGLLIAAVSPGGRGRDRPA
jgi:hypothetical protein